jgi:hypothetical protein
LAGFNSYGWRERPAGYWSAATSRPNADISTLLLRTLNGCIVHQSFRLHHVVAIGLKKTRPGQLSTNPSVHNIEIGRTMTRPGRSCGTCRGQHSSIFQLPTHGHLSNQVQIAALRAIEVIPSVCSASAPIASARGSGCAYPGPKQMIASVLRSEPGRQQMKLLA